LVSETLSLILCSNKGLSESELIDILGIVDRASWSKFFVILRENTSNHGGLLTFYHQHFAEVRKLK
jgi:chromosome segregation and condensation protein ScpB